MSQRDVIGKLTYNKTHKLKSGKGYTPQSLALVSSSKLYVFCSGTSTNHVLKIDGSGSYKDLGKKDDYGHANGATYCDDNKMFYVTAYNYTSLSRASSIYAIDPNSFKIKFTIKLDISATGVAYDRITKKFYVTNTAGIGVYTLQQFSKGGSVKAKKLILKKSFTLDGRAHQDVGGFNGIIMAVRSYKDNLTATAYVDLYDSGNGKYLGSWSFSKGELESVCVDENGIIHALKAGTRTYIKTTKKFDLQGSEGKPIENLDFKIKSPVTVTELRNKVVAKAISYVGNGGKHFWDYSGMTADWCVMFAKCVFSECEMGEIVPTKGSWGVGGFAEELRKKGATKVSQEKSKPGDVVFYGISNRNTGEVKDYIHVEIVTEDGNKKSCGGNTGSDNIHKSTVKNRKHGGYVTTILRPQYSALSETSDDDTVETITAENITVVLDVHPEKLYRSDNYHYQSDTIGLTLGSQQQTNLKNLFANLGEQGLTTVPDSLISVDDIIVATKEKKVRKSKEIGEAFGPPLPVALNPIESPFVELTIGGITFGTHDKTNLYDPYPNYVKSIHVKKTNSSMNEYTIELVHQIRPGSNPNYIDELLSKNGFNKIGIKYGDANSGVVFIDTNALLVKAETNFDFANYNITYMIYATSSSISIASHKQNFAERQDKPSNIIRDLLYNDSSEDLLQAFPAMRDKNFVETNNLIPNDDTVVTIEEFKNVNAVSYLTSLVSSMKSTTDGVSESIYMMTTHDGYFKISQVSTDYIYDASLYEVTINFPDDNQVFSFNVDTDYGWPMAYQYATTVSNYNYDISNDGTLSTFKTNSSNFLDFSSQMQQNLNNNWWTQVNEFPISATLTCRGLLSPLLLLTYIKVNCLCYGNHRITSGVYIVTSQEDSLDSTGYKTTLSLLRVAGINQHLTIDGRVKS